MANLKKSEMFQNDKFDDWTHDAELSPKLLFFGMGKLDGNRSV